MSVRMCACDKCLYVCVHVKIETAGLLFWYTELCRLFGDCQFVYNGCLYVLRSISCNVLYCELKQCAVMDCNLRQRNVPYCAPKQ